MGRRSAFEAFQPYQNYLYQGLLWPSESTSERVLIAEMVPRYAASSLDKLCRWARSSFTYAHLNSVDPGDRERLVRQSMLGRALAARAQGLSADAVEEAKPTLGEKEIFMSLVSAIAEQVDLSLTDTVELAAALARKINTEWTVTVQSR